MTGRQSVSAESVLRQYLAMQLNGKPTMGQGATPLDGKAVIHLDGADYSGTVLGPAVLDGFVWVLWKPPDALPHNGLHRLTDLQEVTDD